jgi:hypothetical protein
VDVLFLTEKINIAESLYDKVQEINLHYSAKSLEISFLDEIETCFIGRLKN